MNDVFKDANPENTKEITLELSNVTGVNKNNFDAIITKLEESFGAEIKATLGDLDDKFISIWPPDMSPDEQRKGLEENDEIIIQFLKVRK